MGANVWTEVRVVVAVAAVASGCVHVAHAPGHAERSTMAKQAIRVKGWQSCHPGACDRHAERGLIRFSNVRMFSPGRGRTQTQFDVTYDGWRAECAQVQEPDRIFACTIASAARTYEVFLDRRCMHGAAGPAGGSAPEWSLHTSTVRMGGSVAPHREVSLVGADGVVALAEVLVEDNLDVYTRRGTSLSSGLLLSLVSVHAFLQLDDLPSECVTRT